MKNQLQRASSLIAAFKAQLRAMDKKSVAFLLKAPLSVGHNITL
jgi:hypothetical protein